MSVLVTLTYISAGPVFVGPVTLLLESTGNGWGVILANGTGRKRGCEIDQPFRVEPSTRLARESAKCASHRELSDAIRARIEFDGQDIRCVLVVSVHFPTTARGIPPT